MPTVDLTRNVLYQMMMETAEKLPLDLDSARDRRRERLALALVLTGIAFRLISYLWNTSFHYDEGWLIQNIQDKSFGDLLGPLRNDQAAPAAYLWLLKLLYMAGGLSELLLRLPSVLAAIGGMLLIRPLARRALRPEAVVWAIVLLAVSDNTLIYAARVKPYTIDALATTVLLYTAVRLRGASVLKYMLILGAIEAGLFWISYPSCFVYGGVAVMGFAKLLGSRRRRDWVGFLLVNAAVGASMYAMLKLTGSQRSDMLMVYWSKRGFPMGLAPAELLKWPVDATYRVFEDAVRPIGFFAMAMAAVAIVSMWFKPRRLFVLGLLAAPLALNFLAACFKLYPWVGSRTSMWNIPIVALLAAEGWGAIVARLPAGVHRRNAIAIGMVIVAVPMGMALYNLTWVGHRKPHTRPLTQHIKANVREGDHIAIAGSNEFRIYFRNDPVAPMTGGQYGHQGVKHILSVLDKPGWKRCWLLVRRDDNDWTSVRDEFLARCKPPLEYVRSSKAELYLFERPPKSPPAPTTTPAAERDGRTSEPRR